MKRIGIIALFAALFAFGVTGCSAPPEEGANPDTPSMGAQDSPNEGGPNAPTDEMAGGGTGTVEPNGDGGEAGGGQNPPTPPADAPQGGNRGGGGAMGTGPGGPGGNREPIEIKPLSKDNPFDDGASIAAKKKNANKN